MKVTFVRDERDRIVVRRDDGSEVQWTFRSYGEGLPHDLVHLVVERHLGLSRGFWGLVALGIDFNQVNAAASGQGDPSAETVADLGDLSQLMLAEMVSNLPFGQPSYEVAKATNAAFNALPDDAVLDGIAAELDTWRQKWVALPPKGALQLEWQSPGS